VFHVALSDLSLLGKALELRVQHGRLEFTQPVIEPDQPMVKFVGDAGPSGIDIGLHPLEILEIIGDDGATFAGRNQLAGLKTEGAEISHRARALVTPHAAMGVGTVFNDFYVVLGGDGQEHIEIGKPHTQVNRKESAGARRDRLLDQPGVQAIGLRVHVNEYGDGICEQHRPHRSFPGVGRDNHFIARLDIDGLQGRLNSHGAGIHALAVPGGVESGKFLSEGIAVLSGEWLPAPVVTGQNVFQNLPLFFGVNRPGIKALFSDRLAASDCQFSHRRFSSDRSCW